MTLLDMSKIKLSDYLKEKFPGINIASTSPFSPGVRKPDVNLWNDQIKSNWDPETMKDHPILKAYRDFFWKLGIDPTKIRPAGEALIRAAFHRGLPKINPIVDAMNIASAMTGIPMSSFDYRIIEGDFEVRFANAGEMYYPHTGANKQLNGNEVVLVNNENILCIYPYRDSKFALIRDDTSKVITVSYGVPGVADVAAPIRLMLQLLGSKASIDVFG
jgi:DNA/RNA-binding domain of Phe-tRNA-synthetase-like protein